MFREFLRFDLRYQLRSPLLWIVAIVLMLFALGGSSSDSVQLIGPLGNAHFNAPTVVVRQLAVLTILALFAGLAFIAMPVLRDFDLGTDELFLSSPMRKGAYLWGRVAAGLVAAAIVYLLATLTMLAGPHMPWVDPTRVGPFSLAPYL